MKQFDVESRRSAVALDEPESADYLVLGDFGGRTRTENPVLIDRDNFNAVLARFGLEHDGAVNRELEDFHPDRVFQKWNAFREFREQADAPKPTRERSAPKADIAELLKPGSLLEQIAGGGDPLEQYARELARAHAAAPQKQRDTEKISEMMRAVLHFPRFQTLEASWRGLDFVLRQWEGGQRIYIAQVPKAAAVADVIGAASLRETRMHRLLGLRQWTAVFGLHTFGGAAEDIEFLGRMALLAAHRQAPFIAEGSADMGESWEELRAIPEASYLGLALPRFLLRLPYGEDTSPIDSFPFEEMPGAPVHGHYLWGNAALACLALLAQGQRDLELEGIPLHTYKHDGEWRTTPCAELLMSEAEASALIELGLMPLLSFKDSTRVRLGGIRAINGKALRLPA